jgi:hypothetical protein
MALPSAELVTEPLIVPVTGGGSCVGGAAPSSSEQAATNGSAATNATADSRQNLSRKLMLVVLLREGLSLLEKSV